MMCDTTDKVKTRFGPLVRRIFVPKKSTIVSVPMPVRADTVLQSMVVIRKRQNPSTKLTVSVSTENTPTGAQSINAAGQTGRTPLRGRCCRNDFVRRSREASLDEVSSVSNENVLLFLTLNESYSSLFSNRTYRSGRVFFLLRISSTNSRW